MAKYSQTDRLIFGYGSAWRWVCSNGHNAARDGDCCFVTVLRVKEFAMTEHFSTVDPTCGDQLSEAHWLTTDPAEKKKHEQTD